MEISKLYENAAEQLEKAVEACGKAQITLTSITVIASVSGKIYSAVNWKTLNDSFEEENTCSEREAVAKMLLAGESQIEHLVTLDPVSKLPVNPCQKCLELIVSVNPANAKCNVLSGKNSKMILTTINTEIAQFAEQFSAAAAEEEQVSASADTGAEDNSAVNDQPQQTAAAQDTPPAIPEGEPQGSASHTAIDASGLQMIFDDWVSSDTPEAPVNDSKPFSASSLTSTQAEVISQVQNMAEHNNTNNMQQNVMYGGQPVNNGMYQQNGMYGQQPVYQQQNGMYGQPMNGMYQQQGMYGAGQQSVMYGQQPVYQQQNGGARQQSLYLNNQQQPAAGNPNNGYGNMASSANSSTYMNKLQSPVHSTANTQSVSVYGTNINDSDNNAIFKDRLNNILNSSSPKGKEEDKMDVMMSAREKKNAAKKDAKKK